MLPASRRASWSAISARSVLLAAWAHFASVGQSTEPDPAAARDFFESRVRPLLVEHCFDCHSQAADELKGGLRLDSRAAVLKGGDSGRSSTRQLPENSLLVKALRRRRSRPQDAPRQPRGTHCRPGRRRAGLDQAGAALSGFVGRSAAESGHGAADRRRTEVLVVCSAAAGAAARGQAGRLACQPDRCLLVGPARSKPDSRRRRPPTGGRCSPGDLRSDGFAAHAARAGQFAADNSPDAYAKAMDRLLASPAYGVHWGRHWLDMARYGDTRWVGAGEDRRLPFAYTYRDWVIRALNQDMPYDRFVTLQLAADQLQPAPAASAGGPGIPDRRPMVHRQPARRDRRPDRRRYPRFARPQRAMCPLPRPQVRSAADGRLLLAVRPAGRRAAAAGRDRTVRGIAARRAAAAGRGRREGVPAAIGIDRAGCSTARPAEVRKPSFHARPDRGNILLVAHGLAHKTDQELRKRSSAAICTRKF